MAFSAACRVANPTAGTCQACTATTSASGVISLAASSAFREIGGDEHAAVGVAGLLLDDQHRPVAVADHAFGRSADEQLLETLLAWLAEHDEVGVLLPRLLDDDGKWITGFHSEPDAGPIGFWQVGKPLSQMLLGHGLSAFLRLGHEASFHDVQQIDGRGPLASEPDTTVDSSLRTVAQVRRDQDVHDVRHVSSIARRRRSDLDANQHELLRPVLLWRTLSVKVRAGCSGSPSTSAARL
jgi:hypothetical protein